MSCHAPDRLHRVPSRAHRVTLVAALTLGTLLAGTAAAVPAAAFTTVSNVRLNAAEAQLLNLVNYARTSRGIPALRVVPGYTDVARRWSRQMATRQSMYHNPDLVRHVVASGGSGWRAVAENVGYGSDPKALFDMYMRSSGHRANILNSRMRYIGMGWVERVSGVGYNTQVFVSDYSTTYGRVRSPAYGGRADASTIRSDVTLAGFEAYDARLTASGATGMAVTVRQPVATSGNDYAKMRVRETVSGSTGAAGMAIRTSWSLSRVRSVTIDVYANTPTGRSVRVDVYARATVGGTNVRIGYVTIGDNRRVRSTFTLPTSAKTWRNELLVVVSRASLNNVSSSLSSRYADIAVYGIGANV